MKDALPLYVVNAPLNFISCLDADNIKTAIGQDDEIRQILVFAANKSAIEATMPAIFRHFADDVLLWLAYPKKTGNISSDISRDSGWDLLAENGFESVAIISIDADWSALRFKKIVQEATGSKKSIIGWEIEGVDYIARTVTIPDDLKQAMAAHPMLINFFEHLSFSHRKEYVESVIMSKKAETRLKRIEKVVATLIEKMNAKKIL